MPKENPEKLDLRSMDISDEKKKQLKQLFPEVFREDKVDFDHLKRTLGEWVDPGKERFGLQWPGKAECMKTIQQPSIATLRPDREESVNFDETENLFIEGDNLEVLKLLQKSYFGKVKMIYIDPPYNTGNEFIYPDNYTESLDTYLKYTGQKDAEGNWQSSNRDTEGRFHSKWLNMMYPRLFLAKNLLKDDGAIFISIDDNELAHLRKICDEIFGEENFVANITWKHTQQSKNDEPYFSRQYNSIICYRKSDSLKPWRFSRTEKDNINYSNPDDDVNGPWRSGDVRSPSLRMTLKYDIITPSGKKIFSPENGWRWSEETVKEKIETGEIIFNEDETKITRKIYLKNQEGRVPENLWNGEDFGTTRIANSELKSLFPDGVPFDTPKPSALIKKMLELCNSDKNAIILDFFAGSCSTAQAVLQKNKEDGDQRKFIMVQLPEKIDPESKVKSKDYNNIADVGKERIRRVISEVVADSGKEKQLAIGEELNSLVNQDFGFKVFKLTPSNFKVWEAPGVDIEPEKLKEQLDAFSDHLNPDNEEESILFELTLKSGFPLTANIEKEELAGKQVFNVENGKLMICLDEDLTFEVLDAISEKEPHRVICLDNGFTGDDADALKTNAVQLFKSKEIEFRTV